MRGPSAPTSLPDKKAKTMETSLNIPLYAGLLGGALLILQNILMVSVGLYRTKAGKSVGVGDDVTLERRVRRHGNLAENAAIFVAALTLYELMFGQTAIALLVAIVFATARGLHIAGFASDAGSHLIGVNEGKKVFVLMRAAGAGLSALSSIVLGGALVVSLLSGSV